MNVCIKCKTLGSRKTTYLNGEGLVGVFFPFCKMGICDRGDIPEVVNGGRGEWDVRTLGDIGRSWELSIGERRCLSILVNLSTSGCRDDISFWKPYRKKKEHILS